MKVLKGSLVETLYEWPDESSIRAGTPARPVVQKTSLYAKDSVAYISDEVITRDV